MALSIESSRGDNWTHSISPPTQLSVHPRLGVACLLQKVRAPKTKRDPFVSGQAVEMEKLLGKSLICMLTSFHQYFIIISSFGFWRYIHVTIYSRPRRRRLFMCTSSCPPARVLSRKDRTRPSPGPRRCRRCRCRCTNELNATLLISHLFLLLQCCERGGRWSPTGHTRNGGAHELSAATSLNCQSPASGFVGHEDVRVRRSGTCSYIL